MKVLKFGGSSVANAENILKTLDIVKNKSNEEQLAVVFSAFSGVTDLLINTGELAAKHDPKYIESLREIEEKHLTVVKNLFHVKEQSQYLSFVKKNINDLEEFYKGIFALQEFTNRIKDKVTSYGEYLSSQLITYKLLSENKEALWVDSTKLIKTNSDFTTAVVDFGTTNAQILQFFKNNNTKIFVLPGFIASDNQENVTTLGRGGSDYTAAILAAALEVKDLEIWTDVSGMMTADPRLVPNAKPIHKISYQEAMELSHFGAKVIYPPTIHPVLNKNITIWIKNTFAPQDFGTRITDKNEISAQDNVIVGISNMSHVSLLTLEGSGMVGIPGFSAKLFQCLSDVKINVILITQSSSEHSITIAINDEDVEKAQQAINEKFEFELEINKLDPVNVEKSLSIIALVGDHMKNRSGVSGKLFNALGKNNINIRAIAQGSSEKNISFVISSKDAVKALNTIHEGFFEAEIKQIHLYISGIGNVGSILLQQINQQNNYLKEHLKINLKIAGIANSKKMIFDENGLNTENTASLLQNAELSNAQLFAQKMIEKNLRNSIFIDVTADNEVSTIYNTLLENGVSVVACNKIAASSAYKNYQNLKLLSKEKGGKFFYETNVGAGLPVIGTINDLVRSGDEITSIKAVLSGSLNFIFNEYSEDKNFAEVVKQAQTEGYTEPDPRLDLSGKDVARKILILSREAGYPLEMEDIIINNFLPEDCMKGSVEDFYQKLVEHEDYFKNLLKEAKNEGCILKFVAEMDNGKCTIGLQKVEPESDLYHLYGKDNIVILKTNRYHQQPMVIKGAGAGAEVTASGVFADMVRCAGF